ncbi:hypothetical protein Droror1_Dr00026528 [Drosera rotundifolia]
MKVDEDPFPKAANVNMVVITLLDESVQDGPRLEGQKLTKEEMRSVQRKDEKRPGVFAQISEPMENLCNCCQLHIALVRKMQKDGDRNNAGPPSTIQEVLPGPIPIEPMGGRTFRPRVCRAKQWGTFVPKRRKSVPYEQLTRTQQQRAQRKYGQRMRVAQRREKQEQIAAEEPPPTEDYTVNTVDTHVLTDPDGSFGAQDYVAETKRPRSKMERWADVEAAITALRERLQNYCGRDSDLAQDIRTRNAVSSLWTRLMAFELERRM